MKSRQFAALLMALLTVSLLAGCAAQAVEYKLEKAEDTLEQKLDAAEAAVEKHIREAVVPETTVPRETHAPEVPVPAGTEAAAPLTPEEAEAIALDHAGLAAEQVQHLRAEFEIDDRIPQYDIDFREGPWEYEYEIHAETGAVLSFDRDD